MSEVWTFARWVAIPGKEEEFVEAWGDLAEWTVTQFPDAKGTLLRDRDVPNVFFSFGPWRDPDQVQAWRASEGFGQRVSRIRELVEEFEPHTLDPVTRAGR